jgi:signal transduction histidine kinase
MPDPPRLSRLAIMGALALAYVAAGRAGLALDAVSGFATLVWAPTGLSLAALVYRGRGLWPGVALGALVVNVWNGASLPIAAGIATGNTLEAVVGALLLERAAPSSLPLRRPRAVIAFVVLAAGIATTISATLGVASLLLGGLVEPGGLARTWGAWWLGDMVGALVVAPVLLASVPAERRAGRRAPAELIGVSAAVLVGASVIFLAAPGPPGAAMFLEAYLLLGPLLWAALRFETWGAAWATLLAATIAVVGTALGRGPLQADVLSERLWALQGFIGLMATTFLVLGAIVAARRDAEREMEAAREAAERSSTAKSRFLAVMSHELRTPLNGIIGYASLMESALQSQAAGDPQHHLRRIRAAAWHLTSVIDGILTFSRAEAGRDELDLRTFDAAELVLEVVGLLEPEAARKGLVVRAVVRAPLEIRSDPGKLRQILLNLVGNAVKFSDRGEVLVEACAESDGTIVVRVRDEGRGIAKERLEAIFEPFNRSLTDGHPALPGIGLGLSVCAMLARLMRGSLTVDSRLGEGSVFTLRIPDTLGHETTAPTS